MQKNQSKRVRKETWTRVLIDGIDGKISPTEHEEERRKQTDKSNQKSLVRMNRSVAAITKRLDEINSRLDRFHRC